jgi:bifunctional enzyme CysN/CysC
MSLLPGREAGAPDNCPAAPALRLVVCGSVGDGKSTLLARLMSEGARAPSAGGEPGDCCFASAARDYCAADVSDDAQYARELAGAAAAARVAVIVLDARAGLTTQTRRHSRIAAMMGVRHVILAVNKMDLAGYDAGAFERAAADYRAFAAGFGFASLRAIPVSAASGANLAEAGGHTPWYCGPTLMAHLDALDPGALDLDRVGPLRLPLESLDAARGRCGGRVAQGVLRAGDALRVLPSGQCGRVGALYVDGREVAEAGAGERVTLSLAEPLALAAGDVLAAADAPPEVADQFEAKLLWLAAHPLAPGRQYQLRLHGKDVTATVTKIKYREDVDSGARLAGDTVGQNEIAAVNLSLGEPVAFEPYQVSRALGGFVLSDKLGGETVGAGLIDFALRRASNIHWQALELNKLSRAAQKSQTPRCIWLTGLSGSGKSTIANLLEKRLYGDGRHTYLLDGDNVRHGLNRDLGFTEADRVENIRRVAEVAKLMVDAGLIVLVSFISPFRTERNMAREMFAKGEFLEVFVDTPLEECERRDVKGLYAKARRGELKNFTGIDSDYEAPEAPEIRLLPARDSLEDCVETLLLALE